VTGIEADFRYSIVPEHLADAELGGLSHVAVRLYAILDRYGNSEGSQRVPGRALLARRVGCSLDTIDRAKAELVAAGYLEVRRRRSAEGDPDTNEYVLRRMPAGVAAPMRPPSRTDAATGSRTHAAKQRENTSGSKEPSVPAPSGRARDELWDALVAAMGTAAPVTRSGRGAWNRAATEMREVGATPELIRRAAGAYRKRWPGIEVTPTALAKHLHLFLPASGDEQAADREALARAWADEAAPRLPADDFAVLLADRKLPPDVEARVLAYADEVRAAAAEAPLERLGDQVLRSVA
jgi:hypothetical protein